MLTRWNPWSELASLQRDLDSLFGRFFAHTPQLLTSMPSPADGTREEDRWRLTFALPGVAPDQIDVEITGRTVRVRAGRGQDSQAGMPASGADFTRAREITLPDDIDVDKVQASYRYGMLELTLPLKEGARTRKIEVMSAEPRQLKAA